VLVMVITEVELQQVARLKIHNKHWCSVTDCHINSCRFGRTTNTSCNWRNNGIVNTCRVKNKPDTCQVKRITKLRDKTNADVTLLAVFTIYGRFLPRQPWHNLSCFTAKIRSRCQVDEQPSFHDSWRITTL